MEQLACYAWFVGVDIAAKTATISWIHQGQRPSASHTIDQTVDGFTKLHLLLHARGCLPEHTLMVLEATGPYWTSFATFFVRYGYQVSVINPLQAHHFAKALMKRAKMDAQDAQMLAQLAATLQPTPWTPPLYEELYQRITQRDALLGLQNQVRNQLHALMQGPVVVTTVLERFQQVDQQLTEQVSAIEAELVTVLADATTHEHAWAATICLLQTIPGIGLMTALWLVVSTLNFTVCDTPEQLAAYAGLAPMPRQSGTSGSRDK